MSSQWWLRRRSVHGNSSRSEDWVKQSPQTWFERFTKAIKGYAYSQCQSDHTLIVKHTTKGRTIIIIIYVGDIILIENHEE